MKATILKLMFGATLWCMIGSFVGWYIGNQGGFNRGVKQVSNLVLELMDVTKKIPDFQVRQHIDI